MELKAVIVAVFIMLGIILIYDARSIARKSFSLSDQNGATFAIKLIRFIISVVRRFNNNAWLI